MVLVGVSIAGAPIIAGSGKRSPPESLPARLSSPLASRTATVRGTLTKGAAAPVPARDVAIESLHKRARLCDLGTESQFVDFAIVERHKDSTLTFTLAGHEATTV